MQSIIVLRLLYLLLAGVVHAVTFEPLSEQPGLIDNGTFGPAVEIVHLFFNEPPIGLAVGPTGRAFVTYGRYASPLLCFSSPINCILEVTSLKALSRSAKSSTQALKSRSPTPNSTYHQMASRTLRQDEFFPRATPRTSSMRKLRYMMRKAVSGYLILVDRAR